MAASADSNSTATSLEDRTEDLDTDTGHNPTRDTLAEGLLCLVRPTIDTLETQVSATLSAQVSSLFVALLCIQMQFYLNCHCLLSPPPFLKGSNCVTFIIFIYIVQTVGMCSQFMKLCYRVS